MKDKDLQTIFDNVQKLLDKLMHEDKYFAAAWALSKAIIAYELKHTGGKK